MVTISDFERDNPPPPLANMMLRACEDETVNITTWVFHQEPGF